MAPDIFPFQNQNTTMEGTVTGGGATAAKSHLVPAATEIWLENPLAGNFSPRKISGQKIFPEKTKGIDADKRLALTNSNSSKIIAISKVEEQITG